MDNKLIGEKKVYSAYLDYRNQVLKYTNEEMNLTLTSDDQVYIAVFDIPLKSGIVGNQTETLALVFGLNVHLYHGSGEVITGLEKDEDIKKAITSLMISASQILSVMELTENTEFYNSEHIRAYLKTRKGIYFRELTGNIKEDKFMGMLLNRIMKEISKAQVNK